MLDIYQSSIIITAFFFTGFGAFALWKDSRNIQVRLFALLSFAFAVWSYSWFGLLKVTSDMNTALFFARLLNFGATFLPIFFLHWVLTVLEQEKRDRFLIYAGYIITVIFAVFSFTDLYIPGVRSISIFPYWPIAGPLYVYFVIIGYFGFILTGLISLIRGFFHFSGEKRNQISFLFAGSFLAFVGGAVNFLLMFGYVVPQPYDLVGIFMLMASPLIFSYAALRYRLFDIKNVAVQLFAGAFNIIFIINILVAQTFSQIFINSLLLVFALWFTVLLLNTLRREVSQRESLALANKAQAETMNFITHQIRGVFTDTKAGLAAIIEGDLGPVQDQMKSTVGHMLEAQNRGVEDVETFLKALHVENGTVEYTIKPFDFKQLVVQTAEREKARAESKKLQYQVHISDGDYVIDGDQTYLGQVVSNLIDNAIRYTPAGSVEISLSRKDDKAILSVKDNGVGIDKEDGKKMFTKYGHGKDSRRINTESTGLGLFIVKGIVDGHKGKIWYESAGAGRGTTFVVELPFKHQPKN